MSNDLTTQAHFLDARADARAEAHLNTRQPLENKGFFPRGGVFIWTISGIALASCGGGGGGSSSGGRARPDPSPIKLADADGDPVSSYTGTINEDGTLLADNAGNDIPLPTIDASVDGEPQTRTYAYEFVTDTGTDATHLGFTISSAGAITFTGTAGTDLDYETAERHTLTVRVTYDSNGATAGGEMHTRDVRVVIDVGNVIDQSEDIILMQDGNVVDSYTASVDEDATAGPALVTIDASVDNAPQVSTIRYNFVGNDQGFAIDSIDGRIIQFTVVLDYETTPRYELTVRVTYDADGDTRTTTDDQETRDVQVVINVNDVPGASPAIIPDRQAFAHQDPMEPDDLGLTPMPDADPSAG